MQHHCSDTIHEEAMVSSSSMRPRLPRLNMKRQIMAPSNRGIEGICHRPKEKPIVSSAISDPNCATISGLVSTRFFEKPTDHASCGRNGAPPSPRHVCRETPQPISWQNIRRDSMASEMSSTRYKLAHLEVVRTASIAHRGTNPHLMKLHGSQTPGSQSRRPSPTRNC